MLNFHQAKSKLKQKQAAAVSNRYLYCQRDRVQFQINISISFLKDNVLLCVSTSLGQHLYKRNRRFMNRAEQILFCGFLKTLNATNGSALTKVTDVCSVTDSKHTGSRWKIYISSWAGLWKRIYFKNKNAHVIKKLLRQNHPFICQHLQHI